MPDEYYSPNNAFLGAPRKPAPPMPRPFGGDYQKPSVDSPPGSPAPDSPPPGSSREADGVHPERRPAPDSSAAGSPAPEPPRVNLWASLPKTDGHLRLPNVIIDHLYPLLDLQERSAYEQLYRLSHGHGKSTCRIGYPKLAARSGMGRTATIQTVERLIKKGLVARVGVEIGGKREQGSEYWVSAPGSPAPDSPGAGSPAAEPNKYKALKERDKKVGAHARKDYSECPDCFGTGMWHPGGIGKGVARCGHPKLKGK